MRGVQIGPGATAFTRTLLSASILSGIIDENVHPPSSSTARSTSERQCPEVAYVASDQDTLASLLFDQRLDLFCVAVLVEVGDQSNCDRAPYAAIAAL